MQAPGLTGSKRSDDHHNEGSLGRAGYSFAHLGWPPALSSPGRLTHRIVAEELTVAAVTELPISLVGGGRGAGASLRAAILFLAQSLICLTRLGQLAGQATVCKLVPLAPRLPAAREKDR